MKNTIITLNVFHPNCSICTLLNLKIYNFWPYFSKNRSQPEMLKECWFPSVVIMFPAFSLRCLYCILYPVITPFLSPSGGGSQLTTMLYNQMTFDTTNQEKCKVYRNAFTGSSKHIINAVLMLPPLQMKETVRSIKRIISENELPNVKTENKINL